MSDKTKQYKWLPWAVAAGGSIVLIFLISYGFSNWMDPTMTLAPWLTAAGVDTTRAINEFSNGVVDTGSHWEHRIPALVSLIVLFVVGPSLWVFSEVRNQSKDDNLKKGGIWYVGVMIIIAGVLYSVPATIIKGIVIQNSWESQAKSRNVDEVRSQLSTLAFDAYEQYYLPQEYGGGSNSFQSIAGEGDNMRNITLADLPNHNPDSKNSFLLAPVESDSVIKIYGIGNKQGDDPNFKNIDGQKGKIQIAIEAAPPGDFEFSDSNL